MALNEKLPSVFFLRQLRLMAMIFSMLVVAPACSENREQTSTSAPASPVAPSPALRPEPPLSDASLRSTTVASDSAAGAGANHPVAGSATITDAQALQSLAQDLENGEAGSIELRTVSELLIKEPRDEAWASSVEYGIGDRAAKLAARYGRGLELASIKCRQTLCEIQAVNRRGAAGSPTDWNIVHERLYRDLKFSNSYSLMKPLPDGRTVYLTYVVR